MKESLNQHALARIASGLAALDDSFPQQRFITRGLQGIEGLELKQRIDFIIELLGDYLPADYPDAAAILAEIPKGWDHGDEADPLRSFAAWPLIDYSARYGLDYPEISLPLLAKLTSLFSSEFAIRPFIKRYPDLCFDHFHQWLSSDDEHMRRLVSEGCRPRLPWGMRLPQF
ncbi:DNA alkylation repair enzyme, partial [hydrothermal vent metagenome]